MFLGLVQLAERVNAVLTRSILAGSEQCDETRLKRKLVADTFNYFVSKIVPGIMGFLTVLVFVRVLGSDQYGRYAVVFATVTAFASGVAGWLGQGVLRFQSSYPHPDELLSFRRAVTVGTALSSLIGSVAVGLCVWVTEKRSYAGILISVGLYIVILVYSVTLARYQASLRSSAVMRIETFRAVGTFILPLLLIGITDRRHYYMLLLGILLGYLCPLAIRETTKSAEPVRIRDSHEPFFAQPEWQLLRRLWQYGWPVALWFFAQQSLVISDRFFIQRFLGFSLLGVYASIYDVIVRSFSLLMVPITLAVHTAVMNHWNQGSGGRTVRILSVGIRYELALFLPASIALWFLAPWVGRVILGQENHQAAAIVFPLALGGFLWQLSLLLHKPLEILCQTKRMLTAMLASLMVNVVGNFLLIPHFGLNAPAFLFVASSVAYLVMLFVLTPMDQFQTAITVRKDPLRLIAEANELSGV